MHASSCPRVQRLQTRVPSSCLRYEWWLCSWQAFSSLLRTSAENVAQMRYIIQTADATGRIQSVCGKTGAHPFEAHNVSSTTSDTSPSLTTGTATRAPSARVSTHGTPL